MTILIGWILFSAVVGVGANTRGRSGFSWFLLSLVISPLLAGLFLLASKRRDQKEKDPFADVATLATIEATPEGSRSRRLLAEHDAKRAAKVKADAQLGKDRQAVGVVIGVLLLALYLFGVMSRAPTQQTSTPSDTHSTVSRHGPMICGIAGPC